MSKPWIIEGLKIGDVASRMGEIRAAYSAHGLVVFPGLLNGDPLLTGFLDGVRYLFDRIMVRHGDRVAAGEDLGDVIVRLQRTAALEGRIVADMCTQHNKLVAANQLKYNDFVIQLLEMAFGAGAVLATPQAGDTLHLFMPGEEFHRYNLPVHQDFQYLMQSSRQATLYLGLSQPYPDAGGLEFWPGSQSLGVLACDKTETGAFRVVDAERQLSGFPCEQYYWEVGDVGLFDSLMCHRSIPNMSTDHGRVVQIFRYSDLRSAEAESYDWRSSVYERRGANFEDVFPDLYVSPIGESVK